MERTKYILIVLFTVVYGLLLGQNNVLIYKAYLKGNMNKWKSTMDSLSAVKQKSNKDVLEIINYRYGYIAWCISKDKSSEAEMYIKKTEEYIKLLEQKKYGLSMLNAYKAALTGYKISISPYLAPIVGPKSLEYAKNAVKIDSNNALGYMQLGNIAFYSPSIFGGSKSEALRYYFKALKIMERNKGYTNQNWNYLNLLVNIINTYMEMDDYEKAKRYCLKALAVEPDFDWIRNNVYLKVLNKIKNE